MSDNDEDGLLMAVLHAYFDESGKVSDTTTIAFCGILAYEDDWTGISRTWNIALKDAELPYVKMGDAMNWRGPFELWKKGESNREDLRDSLLKGLVEESAKRLYNVGTVPYSASDFKALPEKEKRRYRDPLYMCFESALKAMVHTAPAKHSIHLCCDNSEEYSGKCLELYQQLRQRNPELKRRFRALTFAEEEDFAGLQLVDIFAYCQREIHWQGESARSIVKELNAAFTKYRNFSQSFLHDWTGGTELGYAKTEELP
jgi:hypothetical protein